MAFKARLQFGGKEYDVIHTDYSFSRDVDSKGRPSSSVYGGTINVEVESTEDTSVIESMVNNQYKPIAGSLLIKKTEEDAKMKEIKFEDAYIIRYEEGINIIGEHGMTYKFSISARSVTVGNATNEQDWPKA